MDDRTRRGRRAEAAVARSMVRAGYREEARNWRCAVGEIDLVMVRGDTLVFVEVRSVSTAFLEDPTVSVDEAKQARVARAADAYLRQRGEAPTHMRFDVVGVVHRRLRSPRLRHVENAFVPPWAI